MNDELEDILKLPDIPAVPAERLTHLMSSTTAQLLRTHRFRQAQQGTLWTAVFLTGVTIGWWGLHRDPQQMVMQTAPKAIAPDTPPLLTAAQLELQAEKSDDPTESARYYRQAGDLFLEAQDLRSALRCYRIHLNEGGPDVRNVLASDSWLLMNLKTTNLTRR